MSDSSSSTPTSQASTKVPSNASPLLNSHKSLKKRDSEHVGNGSAISRDIFLFLVAFRILNALSIRTFFQPDEYFQSLEPAWQIAFGEDSGAWITWEWRHQLRSSIHPYIFAAVYWVAARFAELIHLNPIYRAELLVAAPKLLQAVIAAAGDYHTWKLGERVYGKGSQQAWATLALTVCSAWQWFASTRTLSNCVETTLTVIALEAWPWQWSMELGETHAPPEEEAVESESEEEEEEEGNEKDDNEQEEQEDEDEDDEEMIRSIDSIIKPDGHTEPELKLQRSLLLAALACVLRPTNILIWICVAGFTLFRTTTKENVVARWRGVYFMTSKTWPALRNNRKERYILVKEAIVCGSMILAISACFDRAFYKEWTFPPLKFLYFNIAQSLAIFYGSNRPDYYLTEGFPLLLTTYLPFGIIGLYQAFAAQNSTNPRSPSTTIRPQLATITLLVPLLLSLISHKEVRFIYPLLPILHVLSATPLTSFSRPALSRTHPSYPTPWSTYRPTLLPFLLLLNLLLALLTTQYHQPAPLAVTSYLRHQHESHYLTQPPPAAHLPPAPTLMTVGFLTPCHSTPWRSHLVHAGIKAWALGCEPPVNLSGKEKESYVDEADRFYADPGGFLERELGKPRYRKSAFGKKEPQRPLGVEIERGAWDGREGRKVWPEYLVFFEGMEGVVAGVVGEAGYGECWRGWNSWVHDDWRRKGDLVVWCLRADRVLRGGRLGRG